MKIGVTVVLAVLVLATLVGVLWARRTFSAEMSRPEASSGASFYSLQTKTLAGEPADLSEYKGQVALVVNTASKCGLTPQYEGLEALYRELSPRGFVILGFPSNDFMGQEPGSAEEIAEFCTINYGVTFPLFAKTSVKGEEKSEIYQVLTRGLEEPSWNFTKYLVDQDGQVVARFGPRTKPDDKEMRQAIEGLLGS